MMNCFRRDHASVIPASHKMTSNVVKTLFRFAGIWLLWVAGGIHLSASEGGLTVTQTLVDYQADQIVVDNPVPGFSWKLASPQRATRQTSFSIAVGLNASSSGDIGAVVWRTGRIKSPQSSQIAYAGAPLKSDTDYHWNLTVSDNHGQSASRVGAFSTALLKPSDWTAQWIGKLSPHPDNDQWSGRTVDWEALAKQPTNPVDSAGILLRKEFVLQKEPLRARIFVTGLGNYELRLNGGKVGDAVLTPGPTAYRQRILYDAYEVASQLHPGTNAIGIMLGSGWFNPQKKFWGWQMQWYGEPRAILQLQLEYRDGTKEVVQSDASWKTHDGPITFNCIYDG
jgi:alpha-L-rhamnosidase